MYSLRTRDMYFTVKYNDSVIFFITSESCMYSICGMRTALLNVQTLLVEYKLPCVLHLLLQFGKVFMFVLMNVHLRKIVGGI